MATDRPIVELPDQVTFDLDEIADILFVVDVAVDHTPPGSGEHRDARRVQRLITSRLWPELGDLLDDDEEESE